MLLSRTMLLLDVYVILARYMKEFDGDQSWIAAQRFYYQALHMMPENGSILGSPVY